MEKDQEKIGAEKALVSIHERALAFSLFSPIFPRASANFALKIGVTLIQF
jgi:hypothetical protein